MRLAVSQSKFIEIAEAMMEKIIEGVLAPGDKVPSVRETAMTMGVTPNTAANAHAKLRDSGVIKPVHGSGSIVQPNAPELCRALIRQKFIRYELPILHRRIRQLGLSKEKVMALLESAEDLNNQHGA